MLPKSIQLSQSAFQFFRDVFKPHYDSFRQAVSETPLVALMWGPSSDWYRQRLEIRDALVERGHQVVFREDLGIPAGLVPQRAVDLIPGYSTDIAIVVQSSYAAIGEVQHFAEFRVVESRMLIFIDDAAKDRRSYLPSIAQLQLLYNNVETFKSPEEIVKGQVLQMVLDKLAVFQTVKYVAQKSARRWGLNLQNYAVDARGEDLRVFPFNLLELHRVHRSEVDLMNDVTAYFLLALIHQTQGSSYKALMRDAGLAGDLLQRKLGPLLTSRMLIDENGMLHLSSLGEQVLGELGLPPPTRAFEPTMPQVVPTRRVISSRWVAGSAVASFLLLGLVTLMALLNTVQSQLPFALTPSRTNTPNPTATVLPIQSPTIKR